MEALWTTLRTVVIYAVALVALKGSRIGGLRRGAAASAPG